MFDKRIEKPKINLYEGLIESRRYDILSDEEQKALRDRVVLLMPGIVYYLEMPIVSPITANIMMSRAQELGSQYERWGLIVDFEVTGRPDARARRAINKKFLEVSNEVGHVSFLANNFFLMTAIKFVMYGSHLSSYSVTAKFEEAVHKVSLQIVNC